MNFIILVGRITKDIELRYTPSNKAIAEISLAVNNGKDDTTFIRLTAFDKLAELVSKYCKKGDLIGTQSIIKNHNWEDKEGIKHYEYSFIINKISFLTKANKEEVKKQDNTSAFSEFGDQLEIDVENMLDD
jgi:single-strand DNA-binding protein